MQITEDVIPVTELPYHVSDRLQVRSPKLVLDNPIPVSPIYRDDIAHFDADYSGVVLYEVVEACKNSKANKSTNIVNQRI